MTDGIYPGVIGGMQKHSFNLACALAEQNVQVDIYTIKVKGVNVMASIPDLLKGKISVFEAEFPSMGKSPGHYIRESYEFSIRLLKLLEKGTRPDFVIAKGFCAWALLAKKAEGHKFPPIGVNFHGYEMFQKAPDFLIGLKNRLLLKSPVLYNVKQADYLFSYGGKITDIILSLGIASDRIIELPSGIAESWLNESPQATSDLKRFLYAGRYERRKGIEELIKVIRALQSEGVKCEFHFVGDIPKNKQFAGDRITFHGAVKDEQTMQRIMRSSDVLLCPSFSEGMPNVILEAMASGMAILATDVGAVRTLVDTSNGVLIEPADTSALSNAIKLLNSTSPKQIDDMKQSSVRKVRKDFMWTEIGKATVSRISSILQQES